MVLLFVIIVAAVFLLMFLWAPKPQAAGWPAAVSSPRQVAFNEDMRVLADGYKNHLTRLHRDEVLERVRAMTSASELAPTAPAGKAK